MELFAALFYSFLRELVPAYYFYIIFKNHLRVTPIVFWLGYSVLLGFEGSLLIQYNGSLPLMWHFINGLAMFPYGFLVCKISRLKTLLVMLLLAQQTFLGQTLALVVQDQGFLPFSNAYSLAITLLFINIIFYPIISLCIEKYKQPFLNTKDEEILLSANLLLIFNFTGTIFLYDFKGLRTWHLFWGRFFVIMPAFLFIIILYYLAYERSLNRNLTQKQVYLERLRESEKRYFDYIFETWQNSRRIRHDMRHIALLLKEYLASKQYTELKQVLFKISQATDIFSEKEEKSWKL